MVLPSPPAPAFQRSVRHRRPRDARPDTIYRVEHRVVSPRSLAGADDLFVEALRHVIGRRPVELFAYALHADGYTLLVRALDDRLPAVIRDLNSRVARRLNERQGVTGGLWQGRACYRSMRHHPAAVAALVDTLVEPVLRGAVDHPADASSGSYPALVQRRVDTVPHTALPWFGTMDDATVARRVRGAVDARLTAARAWSLAG